MRGPVPGLRPRARTEATGARIRTRSARPGVHRAAALAASMVALLPSLVGGPGAASATAAPKTGPVCPHVPERLSVTWGFAGEVDRTVTGSGWLSTSTPAPQHRVGLGAGRGQQVRTVRRRDGSGRPVLCVDGRVRATLPTVGRSALVGAASTNGPYVAWRVAQRGRPGRVLVARVIGGRLRDVRRTTTVVGRNGSLVDTNFVVAEDGTVAWTIGHDGEVGRGAVWPHDGPPQRFRLHDPRQAGVWILDDQNVLVSREDTVSGGPEDQDLLIAGSRRRYRPATPGACPRRFDVPAADLGGWQVATAGRTSYEYGHDQTGIAWHTSCDPATGDYLEITTTESFGNQYANGQVTVQNQARVGRWLLQERAGSGEWRGTTVRITDTADGTSRLGSGDLDVAGVPHASPGTAPGASARAPWAAGAIAAPGVVAWIERDRPADATSRVGLRVADATGTHEVARGGAITDLGLNGTTLRWTVDGVPGSTVLQPVAGEPFAAIPGPCVIAKAYPCLDGSGP
jgi:hypothetical protein